MRCHSEAVRVAAILGERRHSERRVVARPDPERTAARKQKSERDHTAVTKSPHSRKYYSRLGALQGRRLTKGDGHRDRARRVRARSVRWLPDRARRRCEPFRRRRRRHLGVRPAPSHRRSGRGRPPCSPLANQRGHEDRRLQDEAKIHVPPVYHRPSRTGRHPAGRTSQKGSEQGICGLSIIGQDCPTRWDRAHNPKVVSSNTSPALTSVSRSTAIDAI